jgi:hypothetical protein
MRLSINALLDDPRFIPFVYDYCDMRCESCPVSNRCLWFAAERAAFSQAARENDAIVFTRAVAERASPNHKAVARLDCALCDLKSTPREPALGHPLEFLARHYALQATQFLASLETPANEEWRRGSPLETVAWYHFLIAAKTYRALVSHFASEEAHDLLADALGSAKLVLVAIDRSLDAWRSIAESERDDARVGGLMEVLEALRTGVEMRFPEARKFIRPGLDEAERRP